MPASARFVVVHVRQWILSAARELGRDLSINELSLPQLRATAEIMSCGTELEFAPVRSLHGRALSQWPGCPVSTMTVDRFSRQARAEEQQLRRPLGRAIHDDNLGLGKYGREH